MTREEYFEGIEALQKTEGWKISQEMERLGWSYYIFRENYHELIRSLSLNAVDLILFDVRNREQMDATLLEVMRRLHNFVAAANTLVDHTRNIANELYEGKEFVKLYQSKVDQCFTNNPVSQFVQGLRNYTLHNKLPLASATLSGVHDAAITIDIATLRKGKKWKPLARQYMNTCSDREKIEDIVNTYFKSVSDFHDWFFNNQKKLHEEAFAESNELRQRLVNSTWHSEYS